MARIFSKKNAAPDVGAQRQLPLWARSARTGVWKILFWDPFKKCRVFFRKKGFQHLGAKLPTRGRSKVFNLKKSRIPTGQARHILWFRFALKSNSKIYQKRWRTRGRSKVCNHKKSHISTKQAQQILWFGPAPKKKSKIHQNFIKNAPGVGICRVFAQLRGA